MTGPVTLPTDPVLVPPAELPRCYDAQGEAERILEVGDKRWATDDYAARAQEFAETLEGLSARERNELMSAVLDQDPRALHSWLDPQVLAGLDGSQLAMVSESLAAAYNAGHPALATSEVGIAPHGFETHQQTILDGILGAFPPGSGGAEGYVDSAEQMRAFVELLSASSGPEAAQFRKDYASHLIEQFVLNDAVDPTRRDAAAGLAAQLLGNDTTRPEAAVEVLSGMGAAERETFLDHVQRSAALFGEEALTNFAQVDVRDVDAGDLYLQDGLSLLMSAVARSADPAAEALAVEMAGLPAGHGDWFGGLDGGQRNVALSQLFLAHESAVLDAMTRYDSGSADELADPGKRAYSENVDRLGSLLNEILFNPDARFSGSVERAVMEYAGELTDTINASADRENSEGFQDASGRLVVLRAATGEAIAQQYDAIAASREATAETIGFMVDLALSALPANLKAGDVVKDALADALPEGAVREIIQGLSGKIVDEATGRLTTEAKEQIADALGEDYAEVLEQSSLQKQIEEQMLAGIEDERDRANIQRDSDGITGDR